MGRDSLPPVVGKTGGLRQKCHLPNQADRQKIGDRRVAGPQKLGLPQHPAGMLRPTAHVHEQPVKDCLGRRIGDPQPVAGLQDRPLCRVGGGSDMGAKPLEASDFRGQVMHRPVAPGGKGPPARRWRPQRLPPVELPGGPQADAAFDHRRPVLARHLRRKIGHAGQSGRARPFDQHPRFQLRKVQRFQPRRASDQRSGKVIVANPARFYFGEVECPWLGQPHPGHARQPGRCGGQILARLAKKGVHRHRRRQGKRGRNGAGRCFSRKQQAGVLCRLDLGVLEEHLRSPVSGEGVY